MKWLGDGVTNSISIHIGAILSQDAPACKWVVLEHPFEERRPNIEANMLKISQLGIRAVALSVDLLVPIGKWGCPTFLRDDAGDRILARWLVEVGVYAETMQ